MRIAVIGSGAAGLGAAYALSDFHDVTLFERERRLGGHANTVDAPTPEGRIAVDTGFIVYNDRNYPNFASLLDHLGVVTAWSDMSFGFSLNGGALEYACDDLDSIFAQRRNLLNPRFLWVFREVLRFCRVAPDDLATGRAAGLGLGDWLEWRGFSGWFRDRFLLPMGGAIWSTPVARMAQFPAESMLRFFANHDLYTGLAPAMRWRTVAGGSREYVGRIAARLGPRARVGLGATAVRREDGMVRVALDDGSEAPFHHVVLACHAPQSLALIEDADAEETALLGAFRTAPNRAVLHDDARLMPRARRAWSSWNLMSMGEGDRPVSVSYWMNRLQNLGHSRQLFVSLNPLTPPDPARVIAEFDYAHPQFDAAAFAAQAEIDAIQGRGGLWHAGAWLGYGFHEDGLRAGLRVAAALGARPGWTRDAGPPLPSPFAMAAQ